MAETDLHRDWMFRIIELLRQRYRGKQVYISGNLFLYYHDGNPHRCVSPDAIVVKGIDPRSRRIYKVWEEGKVPDVVFETTSDSTKNNDSETKFQLYAQLGIPEYFLFDPTSDYLDPPLRGYRLSKGGYLEILPDANGRLTCEQLDLWVELNPDNDLVFRDRPTGAVLLTNAEAAFETAVRTAAERDNVAAQLETAEVRRLTAEEQHLFAEDRRQLAEERYAIAEERRQLAEERIRHLEAEIARLRSNPAD